jgi:glycosyltransferase 2 family protein
MAGKKINFTKIINRLFFFVGIGILIHIIFLLITTDKNAILQLRKLSFLHISGIAILAILPWIFHSLRLMIWTKFVGHPLNFKDCLSVIVANDLGASLSPTAIGGGPVKLALLVRKGLKSSKATFLVLLAGTEDMIFYGVGILLATYFMRDNLVHLIEKIITNTPLLLGIVVVIGILIALHRFGFEWYRPLLKLIPDRLRLKLGNILSNLKKGFNDVLSSYGEVAKRGKLRFVLTTTLLFMQWISKFSILMLILMALNIPTSYFEVIIRQWIIWMTMLFFPTPGASGGAEAAFLLIFKKQLAGEIVTVIVSTWRFFTYYFVMIAAIVLFQVMNYFNKAKMIEVNNNDIEMDPELAVTNGTAKT